MIKLGLALEEGVTVRRRIDELLAAHGGSYRRIARELGLDRRFLARAHQERTIPENADALAKLGLGERLRVTAIFRRIVP